MHPGAGENLRRARGAPVRGRGHMGGAGKYIEMDRLDKVVNLNLVSTRFNSGSKCHLRRICHPVSSICRRAHLHHSSNSNHGSSNSSSNNNRYRNYQDLSFCCRMIIQRFFESK